ncbi:MAG: hypothetical protein AAGA87_01030 [Pseudomonadota bacterium]
MKRVLIGLAVLCVGAGVFVASDPTYVKATSERFETVEPSLTSVEERGAAYFAFGDFGALDSDTLRVSASPWKLMVAGIALREVEGDLSRVGEVDVAAVFRRFGFHSPQSLGNWPEGLPMPDMSVPLGQNVGLAGRAVPPLQVTVANLGCASCHASVMYDADGMPDTTRVWLGMPNGSINLEAYLVALFEGFRDHGDDPDLMMSAVEALFPETSWQEKMTLRRFILPAVMGEVVERDAAYGRLLPYRGSLPGATNGLDSLKNRLGQIPETGLVEESVFNSVPDLGGRLWRRSLLNTGTYTVPGIDHRAETVASDIDAEHRRELASIVAYFTVPSMGVTNEVAEAHIGEAEAIAAWMMDYAPQPFPGQIDGGLLERGREVYVEGCASCHGTYDASVEAPALVSFPNWEGDVGTDRRRIELTGEELASAVNASSYGGYIDARAAEAYTAPPLTGIWASAPYLHNGSVPTLWHLMRPEARPERFWVGGHALDLERVGLAGVDDGAGGWGPLPGYEPWAISEEINTSAFGLGAGGHAVGFEGLSEADKAALLEYLKLL